MAAPKQWINVPKRLESLSLDVLAETLLSLHLMWKKYGARKIHIALPRRILELVLHKISTMTPLDDTLLSYVLSCGCQRQEELHLKRLALTNVNEAVTLDGLSHVKNSQLVQLSLQTKGNAPISWHMASLRDILRSSADSLLSLRCEYFGPPFPPGGRTVIDFVTMFRNLSQLDLEIHPRNAMLFTDQNWTQIVYSCPNLSSLSLWSRHVHCEFTGVNLGFCPKLMRQSFKSLTLHAAFTSQQLSFRLFKPVVDVLVIGSFHSLRHLDLSVDVDADMYSMATIHGQLSSQALFAHRNYVSNIKDFLLTSSHSLLELKTLDLSGLHEIPDSYIEPFVKSHKHLEFLGLFMTETRYSQDPDCQGDLVITGCDIEKQIIAALEHYGTTRRGYALEALKATYDISKSWTQIHSHGIRLVLNCLDAFPDDIDFQVAGTACLYNMTRSTVTVPTFVLNRIAVMTLRILSVNMNVVQVQKNCLLTFCHDDVLQNACFDRFHLAQLCLLILRNYALDQDALTTRMAAIVLSIVAASLTSKETAALMSVQEISLLLSIVKEVHENAHLVSTLRFTLSALWNLTDDCPGSCQIFVDCGGMKMFMDFLEKFPCDPTITVKVLGALNNLAEVPSLCDVLLCDTLLDFMVQCLGFAHDKSEMYFAGGIVANLLCDKHVQLPRREQFIDGLHASVACLGKLDYAIVTYRSFTPFHRMLASDVEAVVVWAVWAIHHVCSTPSLINYGKLMDQRCLSLLEPHCSSKNEQIKTLANGIMDCLSFGSFLVKAGLRSE